MGIKKGDLVVLSPNHPSFEDSRWFCHKLDIRFPALVRGVNCNNYGENEIYLYSPAAEQMIPFILSAVCKLPENYRPSKENN